MKSNPRHLARVLALTLAVGSPIGAQSKAPTPPAAAKTGPGSAAAQPGSQRKLVLIKASEFKAKAPGLVGQEVEVFGNFTSVGPWAGGMMRDADGSVLVDVKLDKVSPDVTHWMSQNHCSQGCQGVFVRGRIVQWKGFKGMVQELQMTDASFESLAGGEAGGTEEARSVAAKDQAAASKTVLPPGTIPTHYIWNGWAERAPHSTPKNDPSKTTWENMSAVADYRRQVDHDNQMGIIRGPERPDNFETYYRSVRDTGLSGLFKASSNKVFATVWPRVALIVEEKPEGDARTVEEFTPGGQTKTDMCWRLRATVWTGPAKSQEIAPFNWCFSEVRFNTDFAAVKNWGLTPKLAMSSLLTTTGTERTTGPNPPSTPLPDDGTYHHSDGYATVMVANVLIEMGFDYHLSDPRVWFVQ